MNFPFTIADAPLFIAAQNAIAAELAVFPRNKGGLAASDWTGGTIIQGAQSSSTSVAVIRLNGLSRKELSAEFGTAILVQVIDEGLTYGPPLLLRGGVPIARVSLGLRRLSGRHVATGPIFYNTCRAQRFSMADSIANFLAKN